MRARHRTVGAPGETIALARKLRKEMSPPERILWWALKQRPGGFKFRKQCPQGPYSLDFACLEARIAIEVDGNAHDFPDRAERDARRDAHLHRLGISTMRIPALEVFRNLDGVVLGIVELCEQRRRAPPRNGEGDQPKAGGGAGARNREAVRPLHHAAARRGPPPRSGEEL